MKKALFISLALVIALTAFMPAPAMAAKPVPFNAGGTITYITAGTVKPAGDSGRFVVVEREIQGSMSGNVTGTFAMAYKANVELATQAGNLHGTIKVEGKTLNVNGKIAPLTFVPYGPYLLPKLDISGHWNFTGNAEGQGDFTAWAIFMPDPDGHVETFIASSFTLTGQYQP